MNFSLVAIGFISILSQVVLLRELNVSFFGVELIYLLALGIWLLWTAAGAIAGRWMNAPSLKHIAALFIIFGVILPLDIVFIRSSRLLFGDVAGAYLSFPQQLIIAAISIFPAGFLSGILFQWVAKTYITKEKTLALAYAVESLGGLIGGLFSALFIMCGLRNFSIMFICVIFSFITPVIVLKESSKSYLRWTAIVLIFIVLALMYKAPSLDHLTTMWNHPHLLESVDSPYGRITVTGLHHQISVFENDALAFETEGTDAELFCHLTALQHPYPQKVLILGGGIEGILREMAKYKPERMDYVELNPVMLNLVTQYLPDDIRKSLKDPNVNIIFGDPRQYIKKSGKYDLILVGMPQPTSGQANRFYTREFFKQCAVKLNTGGILGFRLRTAENLWTMPVIQMNTSIYSALQSAFPETLFLPGITSIVTASNAPLPHSPDIMIRRLQDMKITTRLISPNYINYVFTNDRFYKTNVLLKKEKHFFNTDIRPICYQHAIIIWLSKFFPHFAVVDPFSILNKFNPKMTCLLLSLGLLIIFVLCRLRSFLRRIMLVASAGFIGMVVETILILYYQVKHGVLYQDIGLLLMSFMGGLALGALIINKTFMKSIDKPIISRFHGIALLAGFCILCAFIGINVLNSDSVGLLRFSSLLAATGFLVAGIFAYVSLHKIEDQKKIISPLYAADLAGGCFGSLLGSLIFIPLAGMDVTTWGILVLSVLSLLLV